MKRTNLLMIGMLISSQLIFAGGLVTNTNQSAAWVRTLSRNATLDVDGVYFNPAGLAQLSNGLHLSLSNQTIMQNRTITNDYQFLSGTPKTYEAELMAPFFPSIYAAYKMDKWTFSAGFNIIGGGGSANFETGLSDFEIPIASLVPMIQGSLAPLDAAIEGLTGSNPGFANITGYGMSSAFNGSSMFMGYQLGATYAINDMISVAIGGRYVSVSNSYEGHLTDVMIDAPAAYGGSQIPGDYLRFVATQIEAMDPATAAILNGTATLLDDATGDAYVDATQKGGGFTPIIGVNIHLGDLLNIAAKYEHHTKMELTNSTDQDDVGMFPDGEKVRSDMPGMFALGASVNPIGNLTATVGFDYYLDKGAYYGATDDEGNQINNEGQVDNNSYTFAASLEYKFLGLLGVSAGFSTGNLGVNDSYQSGISYALKSQTVGGGVFVDIGELVTINAGVAFTMYDDYSVDGSYLPMGFPQAVPFTETYAKDNMIIAIGVDLHL